MGIRSRQEKQRDELKRNILAAAEELFASEGYKNVSMRKIAKKIDYSPTTIYRYFKNKEDLIGHLIAIGYSGVHDIYQQILANRPESSLATLNRIIAAYVKFCIAYPNHYELWFATSEITLKNDEFQMKHGELSYKVYQTWLDLIDECKADGQFKDKETVVVFQLLWGLVHGLVSLRLHHPGFPWMELDDHIKELLALVNKGLV